MNLTQGDVEEVALPVYKVLLPVIAGIECYHHSSSSEGEELGM